MSYDPVTDFLGLLRQTSGGLRMERMPGLDFIMAALGRAELFALHVGQTEPAADQATTVWFKPALQSWASEGEVFLWNSATSEYEPATPALWAAFLAGPASGSVVQDITAPGPAAVLTTAGVVRVNQTIAAPIVLEVPPAIDKVGPVLISDWKGDAGTNPITVNLAGSDVFPGGLTSWVINADTGSIFLRPVPGGYAL